MKIKAAVVTAPKEAFKLDQVELDANLHPNEVLVKVVATGICHTDLVFRDQQMPYPIPAILGHEGAGIVEKTGSNVSKVKAGDHVVLAPGSCGQCRYCKSGHPSYCTEFYKLNINGRRADGSCPYHDHSGKEVSGLFFGQSSFATYSLTTENNLVKVPEDIPLEMLGPLGCGLQTGAGTVMNIFKPHAGESIIIFGVGPVGLAALMAAKAVGCTTIVAVDVHDNRLELAKTLGATHTINSRNTKAAEIVQKDILPGGVHYAFDTTGRTDVINQALASTHNIGHCITVGISASPNWEIEAALMMTGRTFGYAVEGDSVPDVFIPQLISLYKQGLFPFDKLIKYYDLDDINHAVEDSEKGITLKAIIRMPHS